MTKAKKARKVVEALYKVTTWGVVVIVLTVFVVLVGLFIKDKYEYAQCLRSGLQSYDCDFD